MKIIMTCILVILSLTFIGCSNTSVTRDSNGIVAKTFHINIDKAIFKTREAFLNKNIELILEVNYGQAIRVNDRGTILSQINIYQNYKFVNKNTTIIIGNSHSLGVGNGEKIIIFLEKVGDEETIIRIKTESIIYNDQFAKQDWSSDLFKEISNSTW